MLYMYNPHIKITVGTDSWARLYSINNSPGLSTESRIIFTDVIQRFICIISIFNKLIQLDLNEITPYEVRKAHFIVFSLVVFVWLELGICVYLWRCYVVFKAVETLGLVSYMFFFRVCGCWTLQTWNMFVEIQRFFMDPIFWQNFSQLLGQQKYLYTLIIPIFYYLLGRWKTKKLNECTFSRFFRSYLSGEGSCPFILGKKTLSIFIPKKANPPS